MTTLIPSYDTGATTKASDMVYVLPARQVDDDALRQQQQQDLGFNTAFVADILSAALTHERCARHLYRSVEGRTKTIRGWFSS